MYYYYSYAHYDYLSASADLKYIVKRGSLKMMDMKS